MLSSEAEEGDNHFETDEESKSNDIDHADSHVADKHSTDSVTSDEENKTCTYSFEQLLSFPSLLKLCGDVQKLR